MLMFPADYIDRTKQLCWCIGREAFSDRGVGRMSRLKWIKNGGSYEE